MRKKEGLKPGKAVKLLILTDGNGKALFEKFKDEIIKTASLSGLDYTEVTIEGEVLIDATPFGLKVIK